MSAEAPCPRSRIHITGGPVNAPILSAREKSRTNKCELWPRARSRCIGSPRGTTLGTDVLFAHSCSITARPLASIGDEIARSRSRPTLTREQRLARYYFNTFDGMNPTHRDEIGEELPDRKAAWNMATRYAAECLRDLDGRLSIDSDWRLEVLREDGSRLFQITIHADELEASRVS